MANAFLLHAGLFDPALSGRDDFPALIWRGGAVDRKSLALSARRVAGRLAELGIGRGERVALCLPKSPEATGMIFGVLSGGAAYVPLDPLLPPRRLARLLADAQPGLLVTTAAIAGRLADVVPTEALPPVAVVDAGSGAGLDAWTGAAGPVDPVAVDLDDIAVLLYTSGSTGDPKAVVLSHRNVSSFVSWAIQRFGFCAGDRFSSHAPFHFDLSMLDLFAPAALGASVALIDERMALFPAAVVRFVAEHGCTVWYSVPTALHWMLKRGGLGADIVPTLRWVFFAGEVFPVKSLRRLMLALPAPQFVNFYGPTESNVCTYHVLSTPPEETCPAIPIGIPCEHLDVRLCNADGEQAFGSGRGEICVTGPAVMQGYWRRPELTEASRLGGRTDSYRTGDLGSIDPEGFISFHGRIDHQVKIRGHRIELLEIESVLAAHHAVGQTAVVRSGEDAFDPKLVAFVVAVGGPPSADALRQHCAGELPAYGVPSAFVLLDELPSTSRGKVDRMRLAELARLHLAQDLERIRP